MQLHRSFRSVLQSL